jgi:hypothetical protein
MTTGGRDPKKFSGERSNIRADRLQPKETLRHFRFNIKKNIRTTAIVMNNFN